MKGIILSGGHGTRLHPVTLTTSKQLLPVYDKPMVYYPLSVLMLAGVTDILIISSARDLPQYEVLFGDGSALGLSITYALQESPRGLAEALIIGAGHIGDDSVALILGDNLFHGPRFSQTLQDSAGSMDGCVLFGYPVQDPSQYGVAEVDSAGRLLRLEEKPKQPRSKLAVTGLYFYDNDVVDIAKNIRPSARGELEITDVNQIYLDQGRAELVQLGRGFAWLDTGTHDSLLEAGQFVQALERRQGMRIACLEEIALHMRLIDAEACHRLGTALAHTGYGQYVMAIADEYRA